MEQKNSIELTREVDPVPVGCGVPVPVEISRLVSDFTGVKKCRWNHRYDQGDIHYNLPICMKCVYAKHEAKTHEERCTSKPQPYRRINKSVPPEFQKVLYDNEVETLAELWCRNLAYHRLAIDPSLGLIEYMPAQSWCKLWFNFDPETCADDHTCAFYEFCDKYNVPDSLLNDTSFVSKDEFKTYDHTHPCRWSLIDYDAFASL